MITSVLGEPYSMVFEGSELVNNLIPYKEYSSEYTGLGSDVELDFHIENAALKHFSAYNFSPMGLALTGVSFDPSGPITKVSDARQALLSLSDSDIDLLREKSYKLRVPYRWRDEFNHLAIETDWISVLSCEKNNNPDFSVAFYQGMIKTKNEESLYALNKFHQAIKEVAVEFRVNPGQLLYIDNRVALHSRGVFSPKYHNTRPLRWIQRVFVAPNLWNHRNINCIENRIYGNKK